MFCVHNAPKTVLDRRRKKLIIIMLGVCVCVWGGGVYYFMSTLLTFDLLIIQNKTSRTDDYKIVTGFVCEDS